MGRAALDLLANRVDILEAALDLVRLEDGCGTADCVRGVDDVGSGANGVSSG